MGRQGSVPFWVRQAIAVANKCSTWNEGYQAGCKGNVGHNPHPPGSNNWMLWEAGREAALDDLGMC